VYVAHSGWHEYSPLSIICSLDAPQSHVLLLQTCFVGVGLAYGTRVNSRRAEIALDGGGDDVAELDSGMFNREGLVQN